ncbi:MAG TPA: magnesium/cobalt transporter CorA [Burkholderiales bacterium]|nr:magnesium/cobalt transporter CorA [Burkholderiales bacterium]
MARKKLFRSRGKKLGLPPGTLVYPAAAQQTTRMTMLAYDENRVVEKALERVEDCLPFKDRNTVTWINVDEIAQPGALEAFGRVMDFHALMLEDILNTDQRPKIEDFGDYLFIVAKMLEYDALRQEVVIEQLSLVVGPNYVISFQERPGDFFDPIRNRIRNALGRIRKLKADYLAYTLLDVIVDNYFLVLDKLGEKIERLEEIVLTNPRPGTEQQIFHLKRELIFLRKAAGPLRDVVSEIQRLESPLLGESTAPFWRDLYDHVVRVTDSIDAFRDLLGGMMDSYWTTVSTRTGSVMKVLALFSTIFMPLTFITGVFGMNFRNFPQLEWPHGFEWSLGLMALTTVVMVAIFRWKRWL